MSELGATVRRTVTAWRRRVRPRGRVLAVKWGLNPNSSSLGVDVTFFLFGATALALTTPILAALIRLKRPTAHPPTSGAENGVGDGADRNDEKHASDSSA